MQRILGSHFGSTPGIAFDTSQSTFQSSSSPDHHISRGSSDDPSSLEGRPSPRALLPLCVFTCYWGVDDTPVVVGIQETALEPDTTKLDGDSDGAVAKALRDQLQQLKVT